MLVPQVSGGKEQRVDLANDFFTSCVLLQLRKQSIIQASRSETSRCQVLWALLLPLRFPACTVTPTGASEGGNINPWRAAQYSARRPIAASLCATFSGEEAFMAQWTKTTRGRHRNVCFDVHCYHCCWAFRGFPGAFRRREPWASGLEALRTSSTARPLLSS